MNETPVLFPMAPTEIFWKQIRTTVGEVVNEKLSQQISIPSIRSLVEKALLKTSEVCAIFPGSKPTLIIGSDKKSWRVLRSIRWDIFSSIDIEAIILQKRSIR